MNKNAGDNSGWTTEKMMSNFWAIHLLVKRWCWTKFLVFTLCSGRCIRCLRLIQGKGWGLVGCVHFSTPCGPSSTFISYISLRIIFCSKSCGLRGKKKKKKKTNQQTRCCKVPFRNKVLWFYADKVEVFYFGVIGFGKSCFFFFFFPNNSLRIYHVPGTMLGS